MTFRTLAVALATVAVSGSALAASSDGLLDTTSVGSTDVTIVKENAVQISGLDLNAFDFGNNGYLNSDLRKIDDVCIFSTTGTYRVAASSTQAFSMRPASAAGSVAVLDNIPYDITWTAGALPPTDLETLDHSGTTVTSDVGCASTSGSNATITIDVPAAGFNSAGFGSFTDEVTLTVTPI